MKSACIVTALAVLALACTTTTTTTTSPDPKSDKKTDAGDTGDAGKASSDDDASTPSSSGSSGKPEGPKCGDETGQQACGECCAAANQAGATVYSGALQQCLCEADNCATECTATLCATTPKNPDAACNTCIEAKKNNCATAVTDACTADKDCVDFNKCLVDSGCATKK